MMSQLPVSDLDGLTVWHEARLEEEEDIENIPNMANADLVELLLNTRLPSERIIDCTRRSSTRNSAHRENSKTTHAACFEHVASARRPLFYKHQPSTAPREPRDVRQNPDGPERQECDADIGGIPQHQLESQTHPALARYIGYTTAPLRPDADSAPGVPSEFAGCQRRWGIIVAGPSLIAPNANAPMDSQNPTIGRWRVS
jgi:hypothetical protein